MLGVPTWSLADVSEAIHASWSAQTCDPAARAQWSAANPARGQCGVTALVLNDLLGGDLILADVRRPDGTKQGHHYWNRLPDGSEIDLTIGQFDEGEVVQQGRPVIRPGGPPRRCREEYERLRASVLAWLDNAR
jgi:hypothetical protein